MVALKRFGHEFMRMKRELPTDGVNDKIEGARNVAYHLGQPILGIKFLVDAAVRYPDSAERFWEEAAMIAKEFHINPDSDIGKLWKPSKIKRQMKKLQRA